jgi:hypothetical protein
MGERPMLCQWCRDDDPEGCERMGATCQDLRRAWERQPKQARLHVDGCGDGCPMWADDGYGADRCCHPEHLVELDEPSRELTLDEQEALPEPPKWCPLRTADLVLTLEVER